MQVSDRDTTPKGHWTQRLGPRKAFLTKAPGDSDDMATLVWKSLAGVEVGQEKREFLAERPQLLSEVSIFIIQLLLKILNIFR